ncbi:SUF system NifU family Fe-S cluster assembly protein [Ramlibacter tataouinensis]|uniref:Fe-S cluster assembly sulfur transfer protein SufU n=1 Tax=Ramlibacter tataouinensis TaxID=94132 RepID=UPI0022F399C1|nr:SUF system NifU family Fe-S cluster assembly protein [Ramlibacter tataouinensis]WBY01089.1 SUF system NifU family Fe-S cluster assembly protein [Ramlibacter tataouinensis]
MSDPIDDLYQELVLEHKRAPRHFGKLPEATHEARGRNPSCGDDIHVQLQLQGDALKDIRFTGQGCAICIASTSMMTEALHGRDKQAAEDLQRRFRAVMTGEADPEEASLGKLVSLAGVRNYPSRIKCALLGWHALMHALQQPAGKTTVATLEEPAP